MPAGRIPQTRVTVPLSYIDNAHTSYIRRDVLEDQATLAAMVKSIRKIGLILPLLITPDSEIIDGAIRLEALRQLGWEAIPVVIAHDWDTVKNYFIEVQRVTNEGMKPKPMWWMDEGDRIENYLKPIYAPHALTIRAPRGSLTVPRSKSSRYGRVYNDLSEMFGRSPSKLTILRDLRAALNAAEKTKGAEFSKQLLAMIEQMQADGAGVHTALATARSAVRSARVTVDKTDNRTTRALGRAQMEAIERLVLVLTTVAQQAQNLGAISPTMDPEAAGRLGVAIRTATKYITPLGTALRDHARDSQGESE